MPLATTVLFLTSTSSLGARLTCAAFLPAPSGIRSADGHLEDSSLLAMSHQALRIFEIGWSPTSRSTKTAKSPDEKVPGAIPDPINVQSKVKTTAEQAPPLNAFERREYEHAAESFRSFCRDWEHKLRDRQLNNLTNIAWEERAGYETATYSTYGKIETCECKMSRQLIPIGKLTYKEMNYYLVGRTIDEAKRAKPKLIGTTNTVELFTWKNGRWSYD